MILPGESQDMPMLRARAILERPTLELLEEIEKDRSIGALLVRIDSPGGLESPTDQIWRKIRKLGEKKPVIVQAGGVCASGGYYIASGGNKVIAHPYSVVGSIGVLALKPDASVLADKLGLRSETIQRGDHADVFSPWKGWSPEELERLKVNIRHDYEMFLEAVAVSRGMPKEEIAKLAQGRIYSGEAALKLGLIDRLGGFFEALDEAKEAIGLKPQDAAEIVVFPKEKGLFEALAQGPFAYQDPYLRLLEPVGCVSKMLDILGKQHSAVLWPVLFQME
jgi:protease-4